MEEEIFTREEAASYLKVDTQHAYLYAITEVYVCYEQEAEVGSFVDCPHKSDYRNSCNS